MVRIVFKGSGLRKRILVATVLIITAVLIIFLLVILSLLIVVLFSCTSIS